MRKFGLFLFIGLLSFLTINSLYAQDTSAIDESVLLSADQVTYDDELGIVTAIGTVEIAQGSRTLLADRVVFNRRVDSVSASGNVMLIEPTGEVVFTDYVELSDQMKDGVIRELHIILSDNSRLAAESGTRTGGKRTEMRRGVFSPCKLCEDDPKAAPLWQVKARKVVHDTDKKEIRYYDARLEWFGIPVAYTPYLQHPDPTVKRKSGILAPSFFSNDDLGFVTSVPYYFAIDDSKDLTITPIVMTKQLPALAAEYRQRLTTGYYRIAGSGTVADRRERDLDGNYSVVKEDEFRGHVEGLGRFDIDDNWRWGFDVNRTTDRNYLKRYNFSDREILRSDLFAEGFHGRSYTLGRAVDYQDLRLLNRVNSEEKLLPIVDHQYVTEGYDFGGGLGGRLQFDFNAMNLMRDHGTQTRRISGGVNVEVPYTSPIGTVTTVTASARADGYSTKNLIDPNNPDGERLRGEEGRFFPQLTVDTRYPFVQYGNGYSHVIEPIVMASIAPKGGNPALIPNEDSLDNEFDDTNLFSRSRFTGIDRVEGGSRVVYGGRSALYFDYGGYASVFAGQSLALDEHVTELFRPGSGLENRESDYVGRVDVSPIKDFDLIYRFRVKKSDDEIRRQDLSAIFGPEIFQVSVDYLNLREGYGGYEPREEVTGRISSQFAKYYSTHISARRDLSSDGGFLNYGAGIQYQDECLTWQFDWLRNFTRDEDVSEGDTFYTRLVFKHLGEVAF